MKEKAESLYSKGKFDEALCAYEKVKSYGEKDPRIYLRMGDIARKLNDNAHSVALYKKAVESFVHLGFVIKAIAVCKMIINIDPAEEEIHGKLAEFASIGACARPGKAGATRAQARAPQAARSIRLPRTPLFSDFNEGEFLEVVRLVKARSLPAGAYLFREGDRGDAIFFIAEGEVEVIARPKEGEGVLLARLKDGDVFGEFGFFSNSKRSTDVRAAQDTTVLELTKGDLDNIITRHRRVEGVLVNFYKERVVDRLMALSDVFRPLSAIDRKSVLNRLRIVEFRAGTEIMREAETGDTMYLIKQGCVSVWVRDTSGARAQMSELSAGDFFGEIALATNKPRTANVTAVTDVELVEFPRSLIRELVDRYPAIKEILERVIRERVTDIMAARVPRGCSFSRWTL